MSLFGRTTSAVLGATVARDKLKPLGSHAGAEYATLDGREYVLERAAYPDASGVDGRPGDLIIASEVEEQLSDGSTLKGRSYRRAIRVESGTYARLTAEREGRLLAAEKKARPRSVAVRDIFGLPSATREFLPVPVGPQWANASPEAVAAASAFGGKTPVPGYRPARPAPTSARDTVAWWAAKGKVLEAKEGPGYRLRIRARSGTLGRAELDAIEADKRRLWLYLMGEDPLCEAHPDRPPHPATRTVAIDVLQCDDE